MFVLSEMRRSTHSGLFVKEMSELSKWTRHCKRGRISRDKHHRLFIHVYARKSHDKHLSVRTWRIIPGRR